MKIYLPALCLGASLGAAAFAQGPLDLNGDGAVSLEEFQAARARADAARFAELDRDGDGLLTSDELAARRGERRAAAEQGRHQGPPRGELVERFRERLEAIDTDGDGAWSFAELQAVRPNLDVERFNRLDRNGDGLIGPDERPTRGPGRPPYSGSRSRDR